MKNEHQQQQETKTEAAAAEDIITTNTNTITNTTSKSEQQRQLEQYEHLSKKSRLDAANDHNYNLHPETELLAASETNIENINNISNNSNSNSMAAKEMNATSGIPRPPDHMDDCMAAIVLMYLSCRPGEKPQPDQLDAIGAALENEARDFRSRKAMNLFETTKLNFQRDQQANNDEIAQQQPQATTATNLKGKISSIEAEPMGEDKG